jgi:pilus assembly protein CpaF
MTPFNNPDPSSLNEADKTTLRKLETRLRQAIMPKVDFQAMGLSGPGQAFGWPEAQAQVEKLFKAALAAENVVLSQQLQQDLLNSLAADILGFGPLEPLLADGTTTEIMIDGYDKIYVEREENPEHFEDIPSRFRDTEHLLEIIQRIAATFGGKVDVSNPIMDLRLPDGSRVNVVIPPIALNGPTLTIRKFAPDPLTIEDLYRFGSWNEELVEFLRACVLGRLNILVIGGTGSGKTTILNLVASMIPDGERIIKVQSADELILKQKYVVALESRPPNLEGRGEVTVRDLVANALKMRPDRIITGEVRRGEALDLFEAMNTGHDGCMFTVHANTPHDALARLELMVTSANPSIPLLNVRQMMASALDVIVHQERLHDSTRKVVKISEVEGMQGDTIVLSDIFEFRQTGIVANKINGYFTATGRIPRFLSRLKAAGIDLPLTLFTPR